MAKKKDPTAAPGNRTLFSPVLTLLPFGKGPFSNHALLNGATHAGSNFFSFEDVAEPKPFWDGSGS